MMGPPVEDRNASSDFASVVMLARKVPEEGG